MKKLLLLLIAAFAFLSNKVFPQNSPFSVNNQTGQSVTKLTSGVGYGSFLGFQRFNSSVNYYAFETGAGSFDDLRLHVNGGWATPVMAFKPDGSVGIGTASTSYKLDVAGSVGTTNLTINHPSGNSQIYFKNQGSSDWDLGTQVGESTQNFNLYNRGTSTIALSINKGSNNVGIGTTSPSSLLHLKNTTSNVIDLSFSTAYNGGSIRYTATSANNSNQRLAFVMGGGYELFSMLNDGKISTYGSPFVGTFNVGTPGNSNSMTLGSSAGVGFSNTISGLYGLYMGVSGTGNTWIQGGRSDGQAIAYDISLQATGGNVGIGTTVPLSKLHVADGNGGEQIRLSRGTGVVRFAQNTNQDDLYLVNSDASKTYMYWRSDGYVGIGTQTPDAKLAVSGQVHAQEVKVSVTVPGPDYVFEKDYKLTSLEEIKNYIDQNKHLPEVPSAKEMEKNGVQLGEMNMLLLKKIEELTLYMIEQNKKDQNQQQQIEKLLIEVEKLKSGK